MWRRVSMTNARPSSPISRGRDGAWALLRVARAGLGAILIDAGSAVETVRAVLLAQPELSSDLRDALRKARALCAGTDELNQEAGLAGGRDEEVSLRVSFVDDVGHADTVLLPEVFGALLRVELRRSFL